MLPLAVLVGCTSGMPVAAANRNVEVTPKQPGAMANHTPEVPTNTAEPVPAVPVPVPVPSSSSTESASRSVPVSLAEPPAEPLPQGTRVLQIGDSFADALGGALGQLLRAAGLRSDLEFKTPSYIPNWSYGSELPSFLANYQPDLVLITLGANELEMPNPAERAKPIRHLVSLLGGRPCVWVAPPLWKPDTGLLQVIRKNVAPCRYLDSNALLRDLPRARDKIHPSVEGRAIWAKAVFDWLVQQRVGSGKQPWALKPEAELPAPPRDVPH